MPISKIAMDIIANDRASDTLKKVAGELRHTGDQAQRSSGGFDKFKAAGIAATVAVGAAVVGFGKASVDKFKEVGGQVMGLQRVMGGTAEQASRLRFAAEQSGVGFDTLSKSTGKFEKALVASNDGGKKASAMILQLGFNFRDAHGHILPMTTVLPELADKFKAMPNGAEKTALAMKLFGKSGADMIPFLNKGKTGIEDLMKQTDKYGLTLTGANLDALKKSKAGQREWNATLDGLKVQFGAQILPILNKFVAMLRDKVIPFVTRITGFMSTHKDMVGKVAKGIVILVAGIKAWTVVQGVLDAVLTANPIGLVVIALGLLVVGLIYAWKHSQTFRTIVITVFNAIRDTALSWWNTFLHPIFNAFVFVVTTVWQKVQAWGAILKGVFNAIKEPARAALAFVVARFLDFVGAMINGAANAFGWVPKIGPALKAAASHFNTFRDSVNNALAGVKDQTVTVALTYTSGGISRTMLPGSSTPGRNATGGPIRGHGTGTSDTAGVWALSNGEWVIKTSSTKKYGDHAMASVNNGTATIIPGFATGGSPGLHMRTAIPSTAGTAKAVEAHAASMAGPFAAMFAKTLTQASASASSAAGAGSGVQRWSAVALAALTAAGAPSSWLGSLLRRMNQESGGNPRAINLWDSNAKAGTPSIGLMQTIGPTFNAYAGAYRSRGIYDPFANIYAAIKYTISRYGSGPAGWNRSGGYKHGTNYVPEDQFAYLHKGEAVIPAALNRQHGGDINIYVTVPVGGDPVGTGREILRALKAYKVTTGNRALNL
ncbi:phage-related protein [Kribbella aluminosa]|uniref:Phage-related protein n=1 Tax=Kribbella aluminosa TaxID=416017 RepID=A0ABS4UYR5_9ACTN|nr:phage tail tape measure protein [Kribbella aluminosa]MBP2356802.1 phage-related protein [Kribbella aluminosa]